MNDLNIKKKINDLGYTQAELARLMNISPQNFGKRLSVKNISLDFINEIAKALNIKLDYFLTDEEPQKQDETTSSNSLHSYQRGKKNTVEQQIIEKSDNDLTERVKYLERENEMLRRLIDDKNGEILFLREQLKNRK